MRSLNHSFSERYLLSVTDSFVIGQGAGRSALADTFHCLPAHSWVTTSATTVRSNFNAQLTRLFGAELGYNNSFFRYDHDTGVQRRRHPHRTPSTRSGLLNRIEHYIHIDARWTIQPQTFGVLGYRYGQVDYTGNQVIGLI
jgi:hypothetical protein